MKTRNREKLLLLFTAAAVGLLALDWAILTPLARSWKSRSARIEALSKKISQGALLVEREDVMRDRWEFMKQHSVPVDISSAENEVLTAVDRWAQASRISFTSIKPQWKNYADDYTTLECRADAFGDIQAVTKFLFELETDPLPLKVEEVEIRARDNDGRQLSLGVRFSRLVLTAQKED